ncbi:MAG TPA: shikimate dehydrogenase [Dehalococcoidia bacterium]
MTALVGLIGHPVSHSVSAVFQQAAFDYLGIDARYEPWDTPPAALAARVAALRSEPYLGANVTIPHKEAALRYVDRADPSVERTGALNTIVRRDGALEAYNTDVAGFRRALAEDAGFRAAGRRAVVLGAGGAARAVVWALAEEKASHVYVWNRSPERAAALVASLRAHVRTSHLEAVAAEGLARVLRDCDLLVNSTSVGMRHSEGEGRLPLPAELIPPRITVCDVVANPLETPLLAAARARRCTVVGGLPMLVYQGAASFELWTGVPAPLAVMATAARRAMGE